MSKVTISTELLDRMVDALTHLPFREVQPVFQQLAEEVNQPPQPEQEEPRIIHPH